MKRMPKVGDVFVDRKPRKNTVPKRRLTVESVGPEVAMCRSTSRNQLVAIQIERLWALKDGKYKLIKEGP